VISRRQILGAGMAAPAFALWPRATPGTVAPRGPALPVAHLLFDGRFEAAASIARLASVGGPAPRVLPRDALELWYDLLRPAPGATPRAFAGITTAAALFALRTLAADHRLQLRYHAEHGVPRDGRIAHRIEGPAGRLAQCRRLSEAAPWEVMAASALRDCAPGRTQRIRLASAAAGGVRDEPLYSWVIGPAPHRA